jgi:hypothetical protein
VRLAAAERSLKLDHGISTAAREPPHDGVQQQTHAFGDEGAPKELHRILVLDCSRPVTHARQVGGELSLQEVALADILVGGWRLRARV